MLFLLRCLVYLGVTIGVVLLGVPVILLAVLWGVLKDCFRLGGDAYQAFKDYLFGK